MCSLRDVESTLCGSIPRACPRSLFTALTPHDQSTIRLKCLRLQNTCSDIINPASYGRPPPTPQSPTPPGDESCAHNVSPGYVNLSGAARRRGTARFASLKQWEGDRADIVLHCVAHRGQGSGAGVRGTAAEQPVSQTLKFLHKLSYAMSTVDPVVPARPIAHLHRSIF